MISGCSLFNLIHRFGCRCPDWQGADLSGTCSEGWPSLNLHLFLGKEDWIQQISGLDWSWIGIGNLNSTQLVSGLNPSEKYERQLG